MLKIKLSPPSVVNKKYVVFIDRETKQTFTNRRSALDYITKIENELNEALLFINENYSNISNFYRTYFLADRDYKFKYEVEDAFGLINNRLSYIAIHSESENYNSIISNAINICFENLIVAGDLIDLKARHRYDMLTKRRIELYRKIIIQYQESYEQFKAESIYEDKLKLKTG